MSNRFRDLALYVHIPVCLSKCNYCSFLSYAVKSFDLDTYIKLLTKEISSYSKLADTFMISSIYFGGGTPSLLKISQIEEIIQTIQKTFIVKKHLEFSFEINPGTVDKTYLKKLKKMGINRLSIGVQSFKNTLLQKLKRPYTAKEVKSVIKIASNTGFENVSIDMLYGLPGQTLKDIKQDLDTLLTFNLQHISYYCLKLEKNTPLWKERKKIKWPKTKIILKMSDTIKSTLKQHGFYRYEISNYAKKGYESEHNKHYWEHEPYLVIVKRPLSAL